MALTGTFTDQANGLVSCVLSTGVVGQPNPPIPGGPTTDAAVQYSAITITNNQRHA